MAQKFELLQRQSQRLILSPQMQQAIYLLQIPLMELRTIIQQELVTNPVLEDTLETEEETPETPTETSESEKEKELDFKEEFDILKKLDDEWRDYFNQSGGFRKITKQDDEKRRFMLESITSGQSLQEHLQWQLSILLSNSEEKELGELIIGNIDNNGYLRSSVDDIAAESGRPIDEVEDMLCLIQTFNPVGVGARDIKECLLIQLDRLGIDCELETKIIENHLDLVGDHRYKQIADSLTVSEEDVKRAVDVIQTLDPKPGMMFSNEESHYVVPDVFVEKENDKYIITLNDERIPHLYISNLYRNLLRRTDTPKETIEYIKNKIRAGNWLIRNINQRQQTIYKIAEEIVKTQNAFFEEGPNFLKPLTMQELAATISLHESTISRAIANKYMQTPQGTFQLKYFFSSGVKTENGESISVTNLKEQIAVLIKEEDTENPLSDNDIINRLSGTGIKIARRTTAKYRQELGIPSSSIRKKSKQ